LKEYPDERVGILRLK